MNKNLKDFSILLFRSVAFWIVACFFLIIIRYYGIGEEEGSVLPEEYDVPISEWFDVLLYSGCLLGLFYAIVELFFEKVISNKYSLGFVLLLKLFIYLITLISVTTFTTVYFEYRMDIDLPNQQGWWQTSKAFWVSVLYFFISSLVFSFLKIANDNFGRGVFVNMLLGKYRRPQEEERIFMFLDLKDSTTIAENLGHFLYSQFIQDCFLDLNRILNQYDAEIYQYVGDEAVLSWKFKKGISKQNCVALFFDFQDRLKNRAAYYSNKYKRVPEFKAGLHGGKLMIAEVGTVKKELAFHGDVINTTARIQGKCNAFNASLLISEELLMKLSLKSDFKTEELGSLVLRGKQKKMNVFSITKA
ncbi:MAG: adenylate/guanylate cyclase domain-containing protein [Algibacter sp.]